MADPLSIAASIAGLLAIGATISTQLTQLIEGVRSAPRDILDLSRELTDLCSILQKLHPIFRDASSPGSVQHRGLAADLGKVLESCMDKFQQLQHLVTTHTVKKGAGAWTKKWKGWRWTLQEKEVTVLKRQLEAHKATLNITLTLATYTDVAALKTSQDRLEDAAKTIVRLLQPIDPGDNINTGSSSLANCNIILQRYLSSASSVISSRPNSPELPPVLDVVEEQTEEFDGDGLSVCGNISIDTWNFEDHRHSTPPVRPEWESKYQVAVPTVDIPSGDGGVIYSNAGEAPEATGSFGGDEIAPLRSPHLEHTDVRPRPPAPAVRVLPLANAAPVISGPSPGPRSSISTIQQSSSIPTSSPREMRSVAWRGGVSPQQSQDTTEPRLLDILYPYQARVTVQSPVLEGVRKIIDTHRLSHDYSFCQEIKAQYLQAQLKERPYLTSNGHVDRRLYDIYKETSFQPIVDRLWQVIALLSEKYSDISNELPKAVAGEKRWTAHGAVELTDVIELWLELWNQIDLRYEMVVVEHREHLQVFEEYRESSKDLDKFTEDKAKAERDYFKRLDGRFTRELAKRQHYNQEIIGIIMDGLKSEWDYGVKIYNAASRYLKEIHGLRVENTPACISLGAEIMSTREILKRIPLPYMDMAEAWQVAKLRSNDLEYKMELGAYWDPSSSNVARMRGFRELKYAKDKQVCAEYKARIESFKNTFYAIDMSLESFLVDYT